MQSYRIQFGQAVCMAAFVAAAVENTFAQSVTPSRYEPAVLLVTEQDVVRPDLDNTDFGSAFIIESAGELYLTTATHVASLCTERTSVGIAGALISHWAGLSDVVELKSGKLWIHGQHTQLSIARLTDYGADKRFIAAARRIAVPIDELADSIPVRGTHVEIAGFPVVMRAIERGRERQVSGNATRRSAGVLGSSFLLNEHNIGGVTGISVSAFVATRELTLDDDEIRSAVFLSPSVHRGFAGGPVFLHDAGGANAKCVGIFVGSRQHDGSNSGLPAFVPAKYLRELIQQEQHAEHIPQSESTESPAPI